ncbi:MAG: hypothetical protein ABSB19_01445 [Methylomonas sp.]|jgi:hypothetical protein
MKIAAIAIIITLLALLIVMWRRRRRGIRADYIRTYGFPPGLYEKIRKQRPELSLKDCQLVGQALRHFFLAYLQGNRRFVSMPSQVTDELWHAFILYTQHYEIFCSKAFGGFLHHIPAAALSQNRQNNAGLRRIWWLSCREENIDPRKPSRLPLLFAIDNKLKINDGFFYLPDCRGVRRDDDDGKTPYCGTDFSSADFDGSLDGFGDWLDGGDGIFSGDGGCGGGCGGGGD